MKIKYSGVFAKKNNIRVQRLQHLWFACGLDIYIYIYIFFVYLFITDVQIWLSSLANF